MQRVCYHSSSSLSMKKVEKPFSFSLLFSRAFSPPPLPVARTGFFILFLFCVGFLSFLEYNRASKPPVPGVPVILIVKERSSW